MPYYLMERYAPSAEQRMPQPSGPGIRHLSSILVAADETCFSLYEAPTEQSLARASKRANVAVERISEALQLFPFDTVGTTSKAMSKTGQPRPNSPFTDMDWHDSPTDRGRCG